MEHRYNCEMFHDSFFVVAGRLLFTPVSITPLTARSMNNNLKKYLKYTCRGYILIIRKYTPRGLYNRRNTMEEKKSVRDVVTRQRIARKKNTKI